MKGYIRQREDSWQITIDVGREPSTGKRLRHFERVKGSKRDAQRRLHELLVTVEQGRYVKPTELNVGQFLKKWLQDYAQMNTRARTFERYASVVDHLTLALGSIPLTALRPQHLEKYYGACLISGRRDGKGGLSPLTVKKHHRVLSGALKYAVRNGLLASNPAEVVKPPGPKKGRQVGRFGSAEVQEILDSAKERESLYYNFFFTAAYTGLRRGEVLGLRWCDIDLDKSTLSVVQSLQQLQSGEYVFAPPKSEKSRRQIALSLSLVILLWEHRLKQEHTWRFLGKPLLPTDLVFSHPDGRPLRPNSVTRAFKAIGESLGLKGIRLHDLRHAHASILLKQGVHPKIVQERLGHSSISTTLDIYSHVLPGLDEAAARRFEEGLQAATDDVSIKNVAKMSPNLPASEVLR